MRIEIGALPARSSPSRLLIGLTAVAICFVVFAGLLIQNAADSQSAMNDSYRATLNREISISAESLGIAQPNFSDGRELLTRYVGPERLRFALEQNEVSALSLASADFDKDGVPDLVCGYSSVDGGLIALHCGNVDSIYPNSPEAARHRETDTFTDAPFLAPGYLFSLPTAPDLLSAGDFDGDGNKDVIAITRYERMLYLLSGDGRRGFAPAREFELPGLVDAMAVGEVNRRDGLEDIVIAITDEEGPKLLVFEGVIGALNSNPESFDLPERASSITLAQMTGDCNGDVAIETAIEMIIIEGRDRKLYLPERLRPEIKPALMSKRRVDSKKLSIADTAIKSESGAVAVMGMRLNEDTLDDLIVLRSASASPSVLITRPQAIFSVTNTNDSGAGSLRQAIEDANQNQGADTITFDIPGRRTHTIRVLSALPAITETVTIDATTQRGFNGNPVIEITDGSPSLQHAVSGLNIEAAGCLVRGLAINGFSEGVGIVIRTAAATDNHIEGCFIGTNTSGSSAVANAGGILLINDEENPNTGAKRNVIGGTVSAARNLISGNRFEGIRIGPENADTSENIIQGNLIGTDVTGSRVLANQGGITILCPNNTVGGTAAGARNVVSGRTDDDGLGLLILSDSNLVQGNLFGTNQAGDQAIQSINSVVVDAARFNTIGGATTDARNIISGNLREGVGLLDASDTLLQGNFIGTDLSGTRAIGNLGAGVAVARSPDTTILSNVISNNRDQGIFVGFALETDRIGQSGLFVLDNIIGTDTSGTIDLGNLGDGIFVEVASSDNMIEGNVIAFNRGNGITIPNVTVNTGDPGVRISMLSNMIHSNDRLGINLGDDGITNNDDKDTDQGANELQNFPVLNSSSTSAPGLSISGAIRPAAAATVGGIFNSTPNSNFTLQFYFGVNCPLQGAQFIGSIPILIKTMNVHTDNNGNAPYEFIFDLPTGQNGGFVNGTATDTGGNTSELSQCISVGVPQIFPAIVDLAVSGKKLFIAGENFDNGAKILINGQEQKTKFESPIQLVGKKAGKKLKFGDRIQVRNSDGKLSNVVTF